MVFKKIREGSNQEIFETKVLDESGKQLEKWRVLKEDYPKVYSILKQKYSLEEKKKSKIDWAL